MSDGEDTFRKQYGHASTCFCIRRWRGRYLVTPRRCTCGTTSTKKAFDQAVQELGDLSPKTHAAIVRRVREIEDGRQVQR